MSTQIAVRLPDDLVTYLDGAVAAGRAKSRAELVARLIARDERRQRAESELERLVRDHLLPDEEMLAIARRTAGEALPFD